MLPDMPHLIRPYRRLLLAKRRHKGRPIRASAFGIPGMKNPDLGGPSQVARRKSIRPDVNPWRNRYPPRRRRGARGLCMDGNLNQALRISPAPGRIQNRGRNRQVRNKLMQTQPGVKISTRARGSERAVGFARRPGRPLLETRRRIGGQRQALTQRAFSRRRATLPPPLLLPTLCGAVPRQTGLPEVAGS